MGRYFVYIAQCSDGTLYTGSTADVRRRLAEHNSGRGARYTRARLPVVLRYLEKGTRRSWALKREFQIKRLSRSQKLLLCESRKVEHHSIR